jgi:WD40 repeat protein
LGLHNYAGIIGGTSNGELKIFSHTFQSIALETMAMHFGAVTRVCGSPDGRYFFSAGEDGNVFVYQI